MNTGKLLAALLLCIVCLTGWALAEEFPISDTLDGGVTWTLDLVDGEYELTYSGDGVLRLEDEEDIYSENCFTPVLRALGSSDVYFSKVIIGEGVTAVHDYAFGENDFYGSVGELIIGSDVRKIGKYAFAWYDYGIDIVLSEGVEVIEECAFDGFIAENPILLPKSLRYIDSWAFDYSNYFLVYPDTEAEEYCKFYSKDGYYRYMAADWNGSAQNEALINLCMRIFGLDELVSPRYHQYAVSALCSMDLSTDQIGRVNDYIDDEWQPLEDAMCDNDMTAAEILGFMNRFLSLMNELGVKIEYEIGVINSFPGVRVTVLPGGRGDPCTVEVYRTDERDWEAAIGSNGGVYGDEGASGLFNYIEYNDGVLVSGYIGTDSMLTIPAELDGKKVYGVTDGWWGAECTEITVSEGVEMLDDYAFAGMEFLTTLNLPDSLKTVGYDAMYGCPSLSTINFGSGLEKFNSSLYDTAMQEITFSASLRELSYGILSNVVVNIDPANKYLRVDENVLYSVPDQALLCYPYTKQDTEYTVLDGTVSIGSFDDNQYIEKVTLPETVTVIEDHAFQYCTSLTELNFPKNLWKIGDYAFANTALPEILIPGGSDNAPEIVYGAEHLKSIQVAENNPYFYSVSGVLFDAATDALLKYPTQKDGSVYSIPEGTTAVAERAFYWNENLVELAIPASVKEIGEDAFAWSYIETVSFSEGLERIGPYAFAGTSITRAELPASLRVIGVCAFESSMVNSIVLREGLEKIGQCAFLGTDLTAIGFPDSVKEIGINSIPEGVTEIVVPWGVNYLDAIAVGDLQCITIHANVTSYSEYWYYDPEESAYETVVYGYAGTVAQQFAEEYGMVFRALDEPEATGIELSATQKRVTAGDFFQLSATVLPMGNASNISWTSDNAGAAIVESTSGGNVRIRAVQEGTANIIASVGGIQTSCQVIVTAAEGEGVAVLPEGLRAVNSEAFAYSDIARAIIPMGVRTLGPRAFYGCEELNVVEIPGSVESIGADCFSRCGDLILYCSSTSYAAEYAARNEIDVFYMDTWEFVPRNVDDTVGE